MPAVYIKIKFMVNQSQLETVRELVRTSANLTEAERTEWLSLLSFMNDKQLSDLSAILQSTTPSKEVDKVSVPVKVVSAPAQISAPEAELDLPAPHIPVQNPVTPPISPVTAGANTVSAFINRNFATALHRTPVPEAASVETIQKPLAAPARVDPSHETSAPAAIKMGGMSDIAPKIPAAAPIFPVSPAVEAPPTISLPTVSEPGPVNTLQDAAGSAAPTFQFTPEAGGSVVSEPAEEVVPPPKNLEEVRRLNVATLRGRGTLGIEAELKTLCQKFGYFSVQFALEHSPLYQTYLAVGSRVLQQHQSFEGVQAELASGNRPYLTKPEFEEINDLLQRIKSA